jgi:hypothetical protein
VVRILVYQPALQGDDVRLLAAAKVERGTFTVEGERPDLVDTRRQVYSDRVGGFVRFEDDKEEWLRSLAGTFNSAQVAAVVARDTAHKELVAPKEFLARVVEPQHA